MSEPITPADVFEAEQRPGAWPIIQPPIYVMTAGSDTASRIGDKAASLARRGVAKAGPGLLTIVAGAVVTAAAFYYVPRLLEGLSEPEPSETVDLEVER